MGQLGRVLVQVERHYVDPVERQRLLEGAVKGIVSSLDPHSSYLSPDEWAQFQSDTEGKFGGVGIEVDGRGERLVVIAPIEGGPAHRAGIESGDQIVAIDGQEVAGQPLDKLVKRMRGVPGTKISITVLREAKRRPVAAAGDAGAPAEQTGTKLTFELTREIIQVSAIVHKLLDGGIAYVRIKQFQERTHAELIEATAKMREQQQRRPGGGRLTGVLLDVRSNPGGLVDEATAIADEFLGGGGIYSMRHRGRVIEDLKARPGGMFVDVPVVALVDEWSASASELLVGALQDNRRATVVGANTFGKGSVQSILPLPHGAGIKLTTARYYTPSGHAIQADGIHPDVVLEPGTRPPAEPPKTLRERDLPGHLPAEGPQSSGTKRDPGGGLRLDAGPSEQASAPGAARHIPDDPSTSSDLVLRVGYQMLRAQAAARPR